MCEKNADRIYAEIVLICMKQTNLSRQYYSKTLQMNVQLIVKIIDKTFEEIN